MDFEQAKAMFANAQTKELTGHKKKVHSVDWNSTGKKLASCSFDQSVRVWNVDPHHTGKEQVLNGHSESVNQLCWDPSNPERLGTASEDTTARIWDTKSGKCAGTLATGGENINIAWSPDGNYVAIGTKDDVVFIYDARKLKVLRTEKYGYEVNEIGWDRNQDVFLLTTGMGAVEMLRYPDMRHLTSLQAHTANIYCIDVSPNNKYFATGAADALVTIWDLQELVCLRTIARLDWPIRTLSFSHDSQFIASASEDMIVDIAEVSSGMSVHQISCKAAMNTVAWHPKRHLLAFAGDEKDKYGDAGAIKIFGIW